MTAANCEGRAALFDSAHLTAHHAARNLCATCPLLAPCAARRDELLTDRTFARYARGTWAGKLLNPPDVAAVKAARERERYAAKRGRVA